MKTNQPRAPSTAMAKSKNDLDRNGYCVLPNVIGRTALEAVAKRIREQAAAELKYGHANPDEAQLDATNQYVYALINKGDGFIDLVLNRLVLELVEHLIGPHFLLSASDGVIAHPGGTLMPLHTDQWWMPAPVSKGTRHRRIGTIQRFGDRKLQNRTDYIAPPVVCSVMWMISDFSEDNGGTRLVPGSHLYGHSPSSPVPHETPTVAATGKAGSVLVFDGRLWHATGANRTSRARYGIISVYCGPQFRQMENYSLGAAEHVLERKDPLLRRLLGFQVWEGYGKLDNSKDKLIRRDHKPLGPLEMDTRQRRNRRRRAKTK